MENPFERRPSSNVTTVNPFERQHDATPAPEPGTGRDPNDPLWMRALRKTDDFMRGAANGMTFGMADKASDLIDNNVINIEGGNSAKMTQEAKNNSPWLYPAANLIGMMAPSSKLSQGASLIPGLGANTLRSIAGREAVAGSAFSAADQGIQEGGVDPLEVLKSGAISGIVGPAIAAASRFISPSARVRSSVPDLTDAEKATAKGFANDAASRGINLTVPEALEATVPGKAGGATARYNVAAGLEDGSIAAHNFDASRRGGLLAAGRNMVSDIGPGINPNEASSSANAAVKSVEDGFNTVASPLYEASVGVPLPKGTKTAPYKEAAKKVVEDPIKTEAIKDFQGVKKLNKDTVGFGDTARKQLNVMYQDAAAKGDGLRASRIAQEAERLGVVLDNASPEYAAARSLSKTGAEESERLGVGPLGRIGSSPSSASQVSPLFGVTNAAEKQSAEEAIKLLPGNVTRGILSNGVDTAVSTNPLGFGKSVFPTEHSVDIAKQALGQDYAKVGPTLEAARAVNPNTIKPQDNSAHSGMFSEAWAALRNLGSGKTIGLLTDPNTIDKIGNIGPVQEFVHSATKATAEKYADETRKENGRKRRRGN